MLKFSNSFSAEARNECIWLKDIDSAKVCSLFQSGSLAFPGKEKDPFESIG